MAEPKSTTMWERWFQAFRRLGSRRRCWVGAILGIHVSLLAWSATQQSPTYDELFHLAAGIRLWEPGQFDLDRGNPPLFRAVAALPVLAARPTVDWSHVPNTFQCGQDFLAVNGERSFWLITLGRWACISFSLVGAWVCYQWARQWYGDAAGMIALVLWCFCPNMMAYGQLIVGDMAAASMGLLACYTFWRWLDTPCWRTVALAGICWGLAELSKFVWVVLYPMWPVAWLVWRWLHRREADRPSWLREASQLLVMIALSVYIINLGYGFQEPFHHLQGDTSISQPKEPGQDGQRLSAATVVSWAKSWPLPLPRNYLEGMSEVGARSDAKPRSYMRGEFRRGGWWYYYLYAILVKTPLGMLLLLVLSSLCALLRRDCRTDWRREAFLVCLLGAVLCFVSLPTVTQKMRYGLPVIPLLFVWSSRMGLAWNSRNGILSLTTAACLVCSTGASLWVYPHSLSYFNQLAGGPENGHWHLIDANIDWGQDLFYLKDWLDAHPEARPFHFAYFGVVDPRMAGIEFSLPPPDAPRPGWHAVSVHLLRLPNRLAPDGKGGSGRVGANYYDHFLYLRPVARAGYSINIYHVDLDEANGVRSRLGLPLLIHDD